MKNYYLTNIRDFRIWFEYKYLNYPPIVIAKKFDVSPSNVCNIVKKKHDKFTERPIPRQWLEEETWSR